MRFTFILNTKCLCCNKVRINNRHFMRMTHSIINVALMPQCHLWIVGILHCLFVTAQLFKDEFATIFPRRRGVKYGGQFAHQYAFSAAFAAQNCNGFREEWAYFFRNEFPIMERFIANFCSGNIKKFSFRIDQRNF